jgi:diacylglycerol kinase family enzyme
MNAGRLIELKPGTHHILPMPKSRSTSAASEPTVLVLINRRSGTVRSRNAESVVNLVKYKLGRTFRRLDVELVDGDVASRAKEALASKSHDIIVAGGGDGSIASAAAELMGSDITMGALPLGTMNLVVQALGFSPKLEEALQQLTFATPALVDVGVANGRVFLHQISFGLQPRMAKLRERFGYRNRVSKMIGAARALVTLAVRPKMVRVNVSLDGEITRVSSPMVVITNNPIGSDKHWSLQHRLDGGVLGYYVLSEISMRALWRLARGYLRNRLHDDEIIENRIVRSLKIRRRPRRTNSRMAMFKRRKGILASLDGEVAVLDNPVSVQIRPQALRMLTLWPEADASQSVASRSQPETHLHG